MWSYEISSKCEFGEDTSTTTACLTASLFHTHCALQPGVFRHTLHNVWALKRESKKKVLWKMWHFALYDCTSWHESDVKGKSYECCLTPDINPYGYHSMRKIHRHFYILFTLSSLCQIHLNLVCPAFSRLLTQGREVLMLLITGACWDFMESCKPQNYCTLK